MGGNTFMSQSLAKKKYDKKYYARTANSKNSHKRWRDWEVFLIIKGDQTDTMLSKILQRSVKSIQIKRAKYIKENYPEITPILGVKTVVNL